MIQGYGTLGLPTRRGRKMLAHRFSYLMFNGPIPNLPDAWHGTVIMHTCDNRACCNPRHLRAGSQADNVRDMFKKGRDRQSPRKGSNHHSSKLSECEVMEILASNESGPVMARKFGVSKSAIHRIRSGRSWSHL